MRSTAQEILKLCPKPSPIPLIRIGGDGDGAYLLPDDLDGIKACFSPGVSNRKDFEDELLKRFGIESHMCDFSSDIDQFKTPLMAGQTFRKLWLDINGAKDSISLQDWVRELAPAPIDDLMLQMDIEGAEYRNLLATPESILSRFRIIVIELHGLRVCKQPNQFSRELGPLLALLDKHFTCVHAHPNNCCGQFNLPGSDLNIPNVHELTFLRRDRWTGVSDKKLHRPLLPHPLDITANVPDKPPLVLNERWLDSGKRADVSQIKLLKDQVHYLSRKLKDTIGDCGSEYACVLTDIHRLAQRLSCQLPAAHEVLPASEWQELAHGKPFVLSSRHSADPKEIAVEEKKPFFFHTAFIRNQFITIDLKGRHRLFELIIRNRTDLCKHRARCLFYCVHDKINPDLRWGFPLTLNEAFLTQSDYASRTDLRAVEARYITIFSPEVTALHLSDIKIMGGPCL